MLHVQSHFAEAFGGSRYILLLGNTARALERR